MYFLVPLLFENEPEFTASPDRIIITVSLREESVVCFDEELIVAVNIISDGDLLRSVSSSFNASSFIFEPLAAGDYICVYSIFNGREEVQQANFSCVIRYAVTGEYNIL